MPEEGDSTMTDDVAGRLQEQRVREGRIARGDPPDLPAPDKSMIPPAYRAPGNSPDNYVAMGLKTREQIAEDFRAHQVEQLVRQNPRAVDQVLEDHRIAVAERKRREAIAGHPLAKLPDELPSWQERDLVTAALSVEWNPEPDPDPAATMAERKRIRDAAEAKIAEARAEIAALDPWMENL